jgi:hypothetical protein
VRDRHHNLHSIYLYHHDAKMRAFYERAHYIYADGVPLVYLGRFLGPSLSPGAPLDMCGVCLRLYGSGYPARLARVLPRFEPGYRNTERKVLREEGSRAYR